MQPGAIFFHFLPTANQIDIRIAKFMRKFMANENKNAICQMFIENDELNFRKISSHYHALSVEKLITVNESTFV